MPAMPVVVDDGALVRVARAITWLRRQYDLPSDVNFPYVPGVL